MDSCCCSSPDQQVRKMIVSKSANKVEFRFHAEVPICDTCNKLVMSEELEDALQRKANDIYRKEHEMLSGDEIKHIRKDVLQMSREKFADYLSVAPQSIWYWESKGRLHDKSTDQLMRIKASSYYLEKHPLNVVYA